MRPVSIATAFLVACSGAAPAPRMPDEPQATGNFAEEDRFVPAYGKPELQRALIAERGREATDERRVAELEGKDGEGPQGDALRVALADLAIRRRFIATLEACEADGRWCPPRLDEPSWTYDYDGGRLDNPPLDAPLRFDLDSWRVVATELHGRACACRTIACVEGMTVAIDRLETRPMPDVRADDAATLAITRARECLFRLRGKTSLARSPQATAPSE